MTRGAWLALLTTTLLSLPAVAVPRRAVRRVARRAVPAAPARPAVDLQVAGLDTAGERRFPAVLHAIRRDALPALAACVARAPGARGSIAVTLTPTPRGHQTPTLEGALPPDLLRCAREAVARITLPPREVIDDAPNAPAAPDEPVRFELRVRLPAVGRR